MSIKRAKHCTPCNTTESINLTEEPINLSEEPLPLDILPEEVWLHVFSYLGNKELKKVRLTCKYFNELARLPLMQKSKIRLNLLKNFPFNNDEIFAEDEVLPFHTVEVIRYSESSLLGKCLTKNLKYLILCSPCIFKWLAEKPLPNLKKIFLNYENCYGYIDFKNWHLGMYKNLEDININIRARYLSHSLNLFHDILEQKFKLKKLVILLDEKVERKGKFLHKIYEIYKTSSVTLDLATSNMYEDSSEENDYGGLDSE